jgi:polyferredoxin
MRIKRGTVRAFTAALTLVLFLLFFMNHDPGITKWVGKTLGRIQFFPALTRALTGGISGIIVLSFLVLVSLAFGRIYCAVICPLGIFQDLVRFLARRSGRKRSAMQGRTSNGYPFLWYGVLILTLLVLIPGSLIMVNLFDPLSIFGRFCTLLLVPAGASINNLMVAVTETFRPYLLSPSPSHTLSWPLFMLAYVWLILVTTMAFFHGRLYCNTLCPVGAFFSLFSRKALFRFSIDKTRCNGCAKCQRVCRAACIHPSLGEIDGSRCVACFDCMDVCPEQAIQYLPHAPTSGTAARAALPHRRHFLTLVAAGGLALLLRKPATAIVRQTVATPLPVIPPGALGIDHFSATCTACLACVAVCPERVILPGINNFGLAGIIQPGLDFNRSRCAYTCNACTQVCPTNALSPLTLGVKQRTRIGQVVFEKNRCLVYTHKRDCGACAEVCPTHAVHTIKENNVHHPRLAPDACIGCGACQQVCPVFPKAIHVAALAVHEQSGPPFFQKQADDLPEKVMGENDAFPF